MDRLKNFIFKHYRVLIIGLAAIAFVCAAVIAVTVKNTEMVGSGKMPSMPPTAKSTDGAALPSVSPNTASISPNISPTAPAAAASIRPAASAKPITAENIQPRGEDYISTESNEAAGLSEEESAYAEPQTAAEEQSENDSKNECTVSISCASINDNLSKLSRDKRDIIPEDGWILPPISVEFTEGESAFDILERVTRDNGIQLEFSKTPAYNSVYIEGIANIYEFDCGELSGWEYSVNGEFFPYGSSLYTVRNGDRIEWLYTCDLGRDINADNN